MVIHHTIWYSMGVQNLEVMNPSGKHIRNYFKNIQNYFCFYFYFKELWRNGFNK